MTIFVDTSALYAIFDADDQNQDRATRQLDQLLARQEDLVCTNYILVETMSLLQRRFGLGAVRDLQNVVAPSLRAIWVDEDTHMAGVNLLLTANRRQLSLVDCVSFSAMRRLEVTRAFTFDRHFAEQGFDCIP